MADNDSSTPVTEPVTKLIEHLDGLLTQLPDPLASKVKADLRSLRELVLNQRKPRFALIGRRGSGKSSLVNAIFGEELARAGHIKAMQPSNAWETFSGNRGALEILDTRGLNEGSLPEGAEQGSTPEGTILDALKKKAPDGILVVIKATEADAGIDHDLLIAERLLKDLDKIHHRPLPVTAVLTHVDTLEPQDIHLAKAQRNPSEYDEDEVTEKLDRIAAIEHHIQKKFKEYPAIRDNLTGVISVDSYMRWRATPDGGKKLVADHRWQMDKLLEHLMGDMPNDVRVKAARLSHVQRLQAKVARSIVNTFASTSAGIGASPIPIADIYVLGVLQTTMVVLVAQVAGREIDKAAALEFTGSLGVQAGVAIGARELFRQVVKIFPGPGNVVSGSIAFLGTQAIGEAAIAYFVYGRSLEESQQTFEDTKRDGDASEALPSGVEDMTRNIDEVLK